MSPPPLLPPQTPLHLLPPLNTERVSKPITYKVGEHVTVFIPRQDRAPTDNRRLLANIVKKPHAKRYQLQTMKVILKNYYGARHLEPVPKGVAPLIPDSPTVITLRAAARDSSRNPSGSSRLQCNCKTTCSTNCCGCKVWENSSRSLISQN